MTFPGTTRLTFRVRQPELRRSKRKSTPKGIPSGLKRLICAEAELTELSVVILKTQMRNQVFAAKVTKGVLELHQLDEDIVLGVERGCGHWRLEVEREPFLDAFHAGALGQIEEESQVEHDGGG